MEKRLYTEYPQNGDTNQHFYHRLSLRPGTNRFLVRVTRAQGTKIQVDDRDPDGEISLKSLGAWLAALAVLLGAFGAHILSNILSKEGLEWWQTNEFLWYHALAVLVLSARGNDFQILPHRNDVWLSFLFRGIICLCYQRRVLFWYHHTHRRDSARLRVVLGRSSTELELNES